jgi:hypothetical protein
MIGQFVNPSAGGAAWGQLAPSWSMFPDSAFAAPIASASQADAVRKAAVSAGAARNTGVYANAAVAVSPEVDPTAQAFDPVWLRNDCSCRGGTFVEMPGQPQNSYCLPATHPTGKRWDMATRGCLPIKDYLAPFVPGQKYWLYAMLAGVGLVALYAVTKKKKGARQ